LYLPITEIITDKCKKGYNYINITCRILSFNVVLFHATQKQGATLKLLYKSLAQMLHT